MAEETKIPEVPMADQIKALYKNLSPEGRVLIAQKLGEPLQKALEHIKKAEFKQAIAIAYGLDQNGSIDSLRRLDGDNYEQLPIARKQQTRYDFKRIRGISEALVDEHNALNIGNADDLETFVDQAERASTEIDRVYVKLDSEYCDALAGVILLTVLDEKLKQYHSGNDKLRDPRDNPSGRGGLETWDPKLALRLEGLFSDAQTKLGFMRQIGGLAKDAYDRFNHMHEQAYGFRMRKVPKNVGFGWPAKNDDNKLTQMEGYVADVLNNLGHVYQSPASAAVAPPAAPAPAGGPAAPPAPGLAVP